MSEGAVWTSDEHGTMLPVDPYQRYQSGRSANVSAGPSLERITVIINRVYHARGVDSREIFYDK